eukprot:m.32498 g.32498  ORF g.32498 m.32498 type:complete len:407 (-) comp16653_c0_seq1:38-1258(-)
MGASHSLSEAAAAKHSQEGNGHNLSWGLSAMQGYRPTMEDDHTVEQNITEMPGGSFFAVYDGHAGGTVSKMAGIAMLPSIIAEWEKKGRSKDPTDIARAMYSGIINFDANIRATYKNLRNLSDHSGSTMISTIVTENEIIFANVGDSRALLGREGSVVFATKDHKPEDRTESARVLAAGGFIAAGRVCGNLAVSRALGDFVYKDRPDLKAEQQKISAAADLQVIERDPTDQVLVVGCDGIWDVISNDQAMNFVVRQAKLGNSPQEIAEKMLDLCLKRGSSDNMSVIVVLFDDAWNSKIKRKNSRSSRVSSAQATMEGKPKPMTLDHTRGRGSTSKIADLIEKAKSPEVGDVGDVGDEDVFVEAPAVMGPGRGSVVKVGAELETIRSKMADLGTTSQNTTTPNDANL